MRLPQIQFSFEPTPSIIRQLISAIKIIDMVALGADQFEGDLVVTFGGFVVTVGVVARNFRSHHPGAMGRAEDFDRLLGDRPLARALIQ